MSKSYYRQIALVPLGAEAIEELLGDLLGSDASLAGLPELIRERTAGNPFFIEEVVRSLDEDGNLEGERGAYRLVRPVEDAAVPASVEAVLSARIDRLAQREKAVLQAAAVIGKEFPEPVLTRVVEPDPLGARGRASRAGRGRVRLRAGALSRGRLRVQAPADPGGGLRLAARRSPRRHPRGGRPGDRRAVPGAARRAGGAARPALGGRRGGAGGGALARPRRRLDRNERPDQSLRHWQKVRELADSLPESAETAALGLTARIFSLQYGWRLGVTHEDAEAVFTEAERMAAKTGDIGSRAILLSVYAGTRTVNDGDVRASAELGRQAVALAEESGDPALYMTTAGCSYALFQLGEYREGVAILDRAIELADGDVTVAAGIAVGCPYAFCQIFKGGLLVYMGKLEEGGT